MPRNELDPRRIKDIAFRLRNGLKPKPLYEGEQPKLPGEKIIFAHRTETA